MLKDKIYLFNQYLLNDKYMPGVRDKTIAYKVDKSLCSHGGYVPGTGGIK